MNQRRHARARAFRRFLYFCLVGLAVVFFFLAATATVVVFNPHIVPLIDSFMLQTPCYVEEKSEYSYGTSESTSLASKGANKHQRLFNLFSFNVMATALKRWTHHEIGKECIFDKYRRIRCHVRMDGLYLDRFLWWNQCKLTNFTLHSEKICSFYPTTTSTASSFLFPFQFGYYLFHDKNKGNSINVLETPFIEIASKSSSKTRTETSPPPPPALQIQDLSITNTHNNNVFEPVIAINASNVTINVVIEKDVIEINSAIEVPITVIRVGGWTLDELFAMIPPPPVDEGYPKLGTVNITNVKIRVIEGDDDGIGVTVNNEIVFPDEFFYPLFYLTSLAGVNGTDQTIISTLIKKSIVMVLRKHAMNEEGFISKTMEGFLLNLQKSSELVNVASEFMFDKVQEWSEIIDDGVGRVSRALNKFISKVELDLYNAMKDENNPLSRLSKEAKFAWEGFDNNLSKAGQTVASVLEKIENEFSTLAQNTKKDFVPHIDELKKSFQEVEDSLHVRARQVEENVEQVISEVTKDTLDGMKKAKKYFNSLFDEF